jgi:hypothetical protein
MKKILLFAFLCSAALAGPAPEAEPGAPATEAPAVNYTFNAKVFRVLAGDLVALDVDLGFGVWLHNQTFKLQGVTAPDMEADKSAALKAKSQTQAVLVVGAEVLLQSIKDKTDKSKTYHAVLWLNGENLNAEIAKGCPAK